jgi:DNA-directed RNA polymerase sigma subunit (sigma70/sigma32)
MVVAQNDPDGDPDGNAAFVAEILRRMEVAPIRSRQDLAQAFRWARSDTPSLAALGHSMLTDGLLRLVVSIARQYESAEFSLGRLARAGLRGAHTAVEKFDPTTEFKFSTYAVWFIRQEIAKERNVTIDL